MRLNLLAALILFLILLDVRQHTFAGYKDTDVLEIDRRSVEAEVQLIKENFRQQLGLEVQVEPRLISVDSSGPLARGEYSYHEISFGRLNKQEFRKLDNYYRFPLASSLIPTRTYSPSKKYSLRDFLIPKMQPLPGHFFVGEIEKNGDAVLMDANCWSTVHDILYSDKDPYSISGFIDFHPLVLEDVLKSPATSVAIRYSSPQSTAAYDYFIELDDDPKLIKHTAIFIGPGLVFEKTAPSEIGLYRVGTHKLNQRFQYRRLVKSVLSPKESAYQHGQTFPAESVMTVVKTKSISATYALDRTNPTYEFFKKPNLSGNCTLEDYFNGLCE